MIENLPDDRGALDHGDDLHRPAAPRTEQRINLVDLTDQTRPRATDFQRRPRLPIGSWFLHAGLLEEAVSLAIPPGPVGVPAIEERGLLVGVRDVGAHLGQEVQGIEHPKVRLMAGVDDVCLRALELQF